MKVLWTRSATLAVIVDLAIRPVGNHPFGRSAAFNGLRTLIGVRDVLQPLWDEAAIDPPRRPRKADVVLAGIILACVIGELVWRRDMVWAPVALGLGIGVAAVATVRRTHPLVPVAFSFGAITVTDLAAFGSGTPPLILYSASIVLFYAYSLFRWGEGRHAIIGLAMMAVTFVEVLITQYSGVADSIVGAAILMFAAALGGAVRYRAVARTQLVEQAKLQERAELARELHDTVAHHVSAIAIQAQAGLVLAKPSASSDVIAALETIDREAATTLAEMRAIVSALRDAGTSSLAPARRIADIESLSRSTPGSLRVEVALHGQLDGLTPPLEAALYRVAQESITNAQRHAVGATRVDINITGTTSAVHLTVTNDGIRSVHTRKSTGHGLIGMTERVELLKGTLFAGPSPERGWTVTAVLPREVPAL